MAIFEENETMEDPSKAYNGSLQSLRDLVKDHEEVIEIFIVLNSFLLSFVVAAMVEELTKYFCFWMVEHPDFLNFSKKNRTENNDDLLLEAQVIEYGSNESESSQSVGRDASSQNNAGSFQPPVTQREENANSPSQSLTSRRSAITIAMIAAATGFGCIENIEYAFVTPGDVSQGMLQEQIHYFVFFKIFVP